MTEFLTADGLPAPTKVLIDEKGKPFCRTQAKCTRCGGQGGWKGWPGFTCYRCGGGGWEEVKAVKLYTPEQAAKLIERRAKAQAAKDAKRDAAAQVAAAEQAAREEANKATYGALLARLAPFTANNAFLKDIAAKALDLGLTERQIEAATEAVAREEAKAGSKHLGTVGERITLTLTVRHVSAFEGHHGILRIYAMDDGAGNAVVYKGSAWLAEKGETITLKATVKAHGEFRGAPQTILSHPDTKSIGAAQ